MHRPHPRSPQPRRRGRADRAVGLVALGLYYYGLKSTPAVAATLAELAFPVSAILVGYFKFGQTLTGWQWVGVALTSLVVVFLPARPVESFEYVPAPAPAPA